MPIPLILPALAAAAGPIVKRVLLAIGIGTITYVGLEAAFNQARDLVISNYGAIPATVIDIVNLAGVGQGIGIILGAISARVGMIALSRFGRIL